jgi:thiamine kinase-like enzyme
LKILVIDWELSQIGSRAFDLGQCFAELYLLAHFRSIEAGSQLISAFMAGYGPIDEDLAFRIALHFGTHLIVWPCRVPGWGEGEIMEKCIEKGRDYVQRAYTKDIEFFRDGVLDKVFFPSIDVAK